MMIHERSAGRVHVLDVDGPMTYADGAAQLRSRVRGLVQSGHVQLVVNLAKVPYVDSAGLGELVLAQATATQKGGALKLVHAARRLHDLLVVTRLLGVFESFEDEATAVASFPDPS